MNNEQKKDLTVKYEIDGNQIELTPSIVQNYIVGAENAKINLAEFRFFTELCKVRKLNPFLKEAYLIKYTDKQPAQLVVGKDAILKRAVLNENYDGMESGVIVLNKDNEVIERKGTFYIEGVETLAGGWARVFRKDWTHPIYSSVNFSEVSQKKGDGSLNSSWSSKKATMVEKVAKVRALREAFVDDLSGMYEAEEFGQEIPAKPTGADKVVIEQTETESDEININDL